MQTRQHQNTMQTNHTKMQTRHTKMQTSHSNANKAAPKCKQITPKYKHFSPMPPRCMTSQNSQSHAMMPHASTTNIAQNYCLSDPTAKCDELKPHKEGSLTKTMASAAFLQRRMPLTCFTFKFSTSFELQLKGSKCVFTCPFLQSRCLLKCLLRCEAE